MAHQLYNTSEYNLEIIIIYCNAENKFQGLPLRISVILSAEGIINMRNFAVFFVFIFNTAEFTN